MYTTFELPKTRSALLAQMVEHGTFNPRVTGSSPVQGIFLTEYKCSLSLAWT